MLKKTYSDKILYAAIILMAVVMFIPFVLAGNYVFPINDDFSFARSHIDTDPFTATYYTWLNWSGRYFGTFISSLNPFAVSQNPLPLFHVYAMVTVVLTFLAFTISAWGVGHKKLGNVSSLALGCFLAMAFIALAPSIPQLFYWFSSITCYTIPSLLAIVFMALLCSRNVVATVCAAVLALLIPGGNEVTAVLFVMTLMYLSYTFRLRRIYLFTLLAVIGIAIVVICPGNGIRMEAQFSSHPYLWCISVSLMQTLGWLYIWLPALIIGSAIYIPLWGLKLAEQPVFNVSFKKFLLFTFAAVLLAHVPPTLGLSSIMTDRTANSLLIFYVLYYFWGLTIAISRKREWFMRLCRVLSGKPLGLLTAMVSLLLFFSPNGNCLTAATDIITGSAADYHASQLRRLDYAKVNTSPCDTLLLPALSSYPATIFVLDLPDDVTMDFLDDYEWAFGLNGPVVAPTELQIHPTNYQLLRSFSKTHRK